jgi:uncharacterized cupredoxin-like copper-binding protein
MFALFLKRSPLVSLLVALFAFFLPVEAPAQEAIEEYIELNEMSFQPYRKSFRVGRSYKLVLRNAGAKRHDFLGHDFFAAIEIVSFTNGEGQKSALSEGKIVLKSGQKAELLFRPRKPGRYEVWCSISGHREKGMEGEFIIQP